MLDVSPSGFYSRLMRSPSQRSRYDEVLVRQIRRSFAESGESYGVRRVWPDVLAWGYGCGRERVARLMRQETLQARPHPAPFAPGPGGTSCQGPGAEQAGPAVCGESAG